MITQSDGSFEEYVLLAKVENFTDDFKGAMKRENIKGWKRCWTLIPIVLLTVFSIMGNIPGAIICAILGVGGFTYEMIKMGREEDRNIAKAYGPKEESDSPFQKQEDLSIEEVMAKGFSKKRPSDYYTQGFKDFLSEYTEAHKDDIPKPKFVLVKGAPNFPEKVESINSVVNTIDSYYFAYQLPHWSINPRDFDVIMDRLYDKMAEKQMESKFQEVASSIWKYAIADAFVKDQKSISAYDVINNSSILDRLRPDIWTTEDTSSFQESTLPNITSAKVVAFAGAPKVKGKFSPFKKN